ncbi:purine/pyrimidine permease [Trichlorobacter lovleyi]|uniref:solute carrier family 23 protein n=1 Tax=Trichlorobacter lovleyi TaxID=313985 RepID=UPI0022407097|nr:solute carrier family 23 protein [Trichlorobacter lovleyi]QOX77668.1 purine/pyrimidine permease [Trichlorobacter lovleyi]
MEQKPAGIIYGVNEIPPLRTTLLLAFQHASLALVFIVYPLMLLTESSGTHTNAEGIVTASILAMAAGTFLQCLRRNGIGSGFLGVHINNPVYLPVSMQAASMGGIGLSCGMTVIAGAFSVIFSRVLPSLRHLFPAEVCGVGILMLGISMVESALPRLLGLTADGQIDPPSAIVATVTLVLIIALSVWPTGHIRLYSVLIGLVGGYGTALYLGVIAPASLRSIMDSGFVSLPTISVPAWKFEWALLIPFLMTALVSSLDSVAGIVTCQKINQTEWVRPDMQSLSGGILADGIGVAIAGVLGTLGTGVSSAHIALSSATGATARRIGLMASLLLLATAFVPPVAKLLSRMPTPVIGAVLVYAAVFLITSGMGLITSRMMDNRRIFMVGGSIIAGLSVMQFSELISRLPDWLSSIAGSPFAVASICAIMLNLLFRVGTAQNAAVCIKPQLNHIADVRNFFENRGGAWGARRQVVQRVEAAVNELLETVILMELTSDEIKIQARFDEYNLDVAILYTGLPFQALTQPPSPEQPLDEDAALMRLPALLIRQYADRVTVDTADQHQRVTLHFEH